MRAMLDTHTFLWWITDSNLLSAKVAQFIGNAGNELFLIAAGIWELVIKVRIGRLVLPAKVEEFIPEQMSVNSIHPLSITITHVLQTYNLPMLHKDPFDRILVAQSQVEQLPLLTNDENIKRYGITTIW